MPFFKRILIGLCLCVLPAFAQGGMTSLLGAAGPSTGVVTGFPIFSSTGGISSTITTASATFTVGDVAACLVTTIDSSPPTSVTDPGGNSYTGQGDVVQTGVEAGEWFVAKITTGFTGVITGHHTSGAIHAIACYELQGIAGTVDQNQTAMGTSGTVTSASFTTMQAKEISLGGIGDPDNPCTSFSSNTAGYTYDGPDGAISVGVMHAVFSSIQTSVTASMKETGCSVGNTILGVITLY